MRVLALDPGERVGWATGTVGGPLPGTSETWLTVHDHGIAYLKDMAMAAYKAILAGKYDVVVIEKFALTAKGAKTLVGSEFPWVQFDGMIRLCCWVSGTKYEPQRPVVMKTARRWLKTDVPGAEDVAQRVAAADAVAHDDGHDGSALLHLWHYYFKEFV